MNIESVDLIVRNAYIVTMDPDRRVLTNGLIAIKNGVLTAIGTDRGISGAIRADRTIDAHGALVHPGFIDTHIHLLYHNIRWGIEDGAGWGEALPIHQEYGQLVDPDIASVSAGPACILAALISTVGDISAQDESWESLRPYQGGRPNQPFGSTVSSRSTKYTWVRNYPCLTPERPGS